jgi:hypothetical protein
MGITVVLKVETEEQHYFTKTECDILRLFIFQTFLQQMLQNI